MNYSEVKSLLDAGFTADEIRTMLNNPQNPQDIPQPTDPEPTPAPDPAPTPTPTPTPDPDPAPADERFNQLNDTMNRILKAIQTSNRNTTTVNTVQPDLDTEVDKIMNGIIRPEKEEH